MSEGYKGRIGSIIRDARKHRGLTQQQLADRLSTSQSAINRIEKGHQNLSLDMLARIGSALDSEIVALGAGPTHLRVTGPTDSRARSTSRPPRTPGSRCSAPPCSTAAAPRCARWRGSRRSTGCSRCSSLGVQTRWLNDDNDLEIVPPKELELDSIDETAARRTRSIIMFLGPLLHREDIFELPYAGGCDLGTRTVEPHMTPCGPSASRSRPPTAFTTRRSTGRSSRPPRSCSPSAATRSPRTP